MTRCGFCGAQLDTGATLCRLCQGKASTILEYLPVYFGNLARWRPGRTTTRQVPGSRVLWDGAIRIGSGDRISDTLAAADIALLKWANIIVTHRPYLGRLLYRLTAARAAETIDTAGAVAWLCAGMTRHLDAIATLTNAGQFVRDLDHHETRLRALTESYIPGWYAGSCRRCSSPTYVVPGLTWVTCGMCGTTSHAADHLDIVLTEARSWVAPPMRLAEAVVALVDTEPSIPRLYERIKKWGQRERITTHRAVDTDGDEIGPNRYRLGDVLDLLAVEGATPITTPGKRASV